MPESEIPNNLPKVLKKLFGREEEVQALRRKLSENSMVTILGTGGCGKSRLAVEMGKLLKNEFPDGVWFISLSDLADKADEEHLLPSRIGKVAGIPEKPTAPPNDSLIDHFAKGKYLLILDNCEHLVTSCRELSVTLLDACSDLRILATSRVKLDALPYEETYPLNPLAVPNSDDSSADAILHSSAVQLFLERATNQPKLSTNLDDLNAVAGICRDLAGIPLAIEIAAARLSLRSVQDLRKETSRLFDKNSADLRKWQVLSAAIEWSYRLLSPPLQSFIRALSVFDGGFTLQAAAAVCDAGSTPDGVEDSMQTLLDLSLVVNRVVHSSMRFSFLVPIRQFLQQQITAVELEEYQRRHAIWFRDLAEESAPKLLTGEQNATLELLQVEVDNFRAALRWLVGHGQCEMALRLMAALWRFTEIRAYYTEGLARAQDVLAMPGADAFPDLQCKLLSGAGMLAYRMANFPLANQLFERCLQIATAKNDQVEVADAYSGLGLVAMMAGDFPAAQGYQIRCRDMEWINKNDRNAAVATYNLGFIALGMGQYDDARTFLNEALQQFESAGNERESAFAYGSLARCYIVAKNFDTANDFAQKALTIRRGLQDNKTVADTLRTVAWLAIEKNQHAQALEALKEAVGLARGVDDARGVSEALELYALICAKEGSTKQSVVLAAAAANIRGVYGYALPPVLIAQREDALAKAKEILGELEYSRNWTRGGLMKAADAIPEAMAVLAMPEESKAQAIAPVAGVRKIFISYNHGDQTTALKMRDDLRKRGFGVILDVDSMRAGAAIEDFIHNSVRDADAVVSIVSSMSLLSGWVALETISTFERERSDERDHLIACTLTDDFYKAEYRLTCTAQIQKRLDELAALYDEYAKKNLDPVDLDDERKRLNSLRNDLGDILARLKKCLCLDVRDAQFSDSMDRLALALHPSMASSGSPQ